MTDNLVQAIFDILQEYGSSILSTPRMFELVLGQKAKVSDKELEAISAAVRGGAITDLLNSPNMDLGMLAQSLAGRAGVPLHTARWSLEIWQVALRHAVAGKAPPKADWETLRLVQPPADRGPARVVAATLLLIALTGAIAGASPGVLVAIGLERKHPQAERLRNLVEKHEIPGMRMAPREFAAWTGTLGGIGGFLGGAWLARWRLQTDHADAHPRRHDRRELGLRCGGLWHGAIWLGRRLLRPPLCRRELRVALHYARAARDSHGAGAALMVGLAAFLSRVREWSVKCLQVARSHSPAERTAMPFSLPALPYAHDALEPSIDKMTMEIHHGRHHKAYVDNLNKALERRPTWPNKPIERSAARISTPCPRRSARPSSTTAAATPITRCSGKSWAPAAAATRAATWPRRSTRTFGDFDAFKAKIKEAALGRFGSGWSWLVVSGDGKLHVISTANQDSRSGTARRRSWASTCGNTPTT